MSYLKLEANVFNIFRTNPTKRSIQKINSLANSLSKEAKVLSNSFEQLSSDSWDGIRFLNALENLQKSMQTMSKFANRNIVYTTIGLKKKGV